MSRNNKFKYKVREIEEHQYKIRQAIIEGDMSSFSTLMALLEKSQARFEATYIPKAH